MAARLEDACALGKDTAVLQGGRETSAPICAKLGFERSAESISPRGPLAKALTKNSIATAAGTKRSAG